MTIKEQENQLKLNLRLLTFMSVVVWMLAVVFVGYRYYSSRTIPVLNQTTQTAIPSVKQENINTLRSSVKNVTVVNLPVIRPEPFD